MRLHAENKKIVFDLNCKTLYTKADVRPSWQKSPEKGIIENLAAETKEIPHFYIAIDCSDSEKAAKILKNQYHQGGRDFVLETGEFSKKKQTIQNNLLNKITKIKNNQNYIFDFDTIFGDIDLSKLWINIRSNDSFEALILARDFVEYCQKNNISCRRLDVDVSADLIEKIHHPQMQDYFSGFISKIPQISTISACDGAYHLANCASEAEQIAFIIAELLEKLRILEKIDNKFQIYSQKLRMIVGIDQRLYYNIAKIRALRRLWKFVTSKCDGINTNNKAEIYASANYAMFTRSDLVSNVLRLNSACCSALLANVDHVELPPFTAAFGNRADEASSASARRTSFTIPLIAWHEANIGQIADPMAGSYMIESISDQITEKAYQILQKIEKNGGYKTFLKSKQKISRQNKNIVKNKKMLATRKKILIGVNHFATINETMEPMQYMFGKYPIEENKNNAYYPSLDFELIRQRVNILATKKQNFILPIITKPNLVKQATGFIDNILACAGIRAKLINDYNDMKNLPLIIYDHENNATKKYNKLIKQAFSYAPKAIFYLMAGENNRKIINSRLPIIKSYFTKEFDMIVFLHDIVSSMEH